MTERDPSGLGTILGVWAHPDDEGYLSAGIMAAAVDAGNRVMCVTATRGEAGSLDHGKWPPETLGAVREAHRDCKFIRRTSRAAQSRRADRRETRSC